MPRRAALKVHSPQMVVDHVLRTAADERNSAGVMLIPTQERFPAHVLSLRRPIKRSDGTLGEIVATGVEGIGLARGTDNDIFIALINFYLDARRNDGETIHTTPRALLTYAGLDTGGKHYAALSQGLNRILNTTFSIHDVWYDARVMRYTFKNFRIIDTLEATGPGAGGPGLNLDGRSVLKITLSKAIRDSIDAGYIKPLNLDLYRSLGSSPARNLYRYLDTWLDELRTRPTTGPSYEFSADILELAANCGVMSDRLDNVRRALEGATKTLIDQGYLEGITTVGRGRKTTILVTFSERPPGTELPRYATDLIAEGVSVGVAANFAQLLGEQIPTIITTFRRDVERRASTNPIRDRGAYLAALLRSEAQRHTVTPPAAPSVKAERAPVPAPEMLLTPMERLIQATSDDEYDTCDKELALDVIFSAAKLKLLGDSGVTTATIDILRERARQGTIQMSVLRRHVLMAAARMPGALDPLLS